MIDLAIQNIRQQKTRTFLTMLGIVIGIGAVVALGTISEGLNKRVQQNLELNAGKIMVSQKGSSGFLVGFTGSELSQENVEEIASVSGVKEVVPQLYYWENIVPFKGPEWVAIGIETSKTEFFKGESIMIEKGRDLEENDGEVLVAGKKFADTYNLDVGDFFTIKDRDVEVVGILEESGVQNIDDYFIMPLKALQDITDKDFYPIVYVIPEDIKETEILAQRIEDNNEDFDAITSTEIARQAGQIVDQVRFFTLGIGAVAAVVGGLGILNTMIMSVLERKREIGVMKALGATRRSILVHFLTESVIIAALGGLIGLLLGSMVSGLFLGSMTAATPSLLIGSFIFAVALGFIGGLYPAWKAAKQDPVEALRYE